MSINSESTDRNAADFVLFALGFGGFIMMAGGIVTAVAGMAMVGALLLLIVVLSFWLRSTLG